MKNSADWEFVLNTVDGLFYRVALSIACRADMSLADCHEALWSSFEQGCFKLKPGDDDDVEVVPCQSYYDRHVAMEQNKPLADYRAARHRGGGRGGLGALHDYRLPDRRAALARLLPEDSRAEQEFHRRMVRKY